MPDLEYINLKEIRHDLAGFFKAVNSGRSFAVYQKTIQLAVIGRINTAHQPTISKARTAKAIADDTAARVDRLFKVIGLAQIEAEHHQKSKHLMSKARDTRQESS